MSSIENLHHGKKYQIKIGTCIRGAHLLDDLRNAVSMGFDTVELYYNDTLSGADFDMLAPKMREIIGDSGVEISGIGLYCNPLINESTRQELVYCIKKARDLGTDFVGTFAGAIPGKSVDDAMPAFKKCFSELTAIAEAYGVRIGIENAPMYGHWYSATSNIGFCPRAWEMIFEEVPSEHLGLEWEPSHQVQQLIEPIAQLKAYLPKVFHVHGKDASVDWNAVRTYGIWFGSHYCDHRFPGMGDTDWQEIIKLLYEADYQGDITIEGYHDPVYCSDRELEGQKLALEYLRGNQSR
ncbi:MAG: sugar phosphate isomerase/epimerase [Lachnospiraceae bacterium]|nr:sugar phosphate isomerase/epimerase [Lachnospiraceae bacterium]